MNKLYNVEQLRKIIAESIEEFEPVIGKDVEKDNKKNNTESYKDAQKRAKDFDGGLTEDTGNPSVEDSIFQTAADRDNMGMERLKYTNPVGEPFKKRVQAQIMGKNSDLEEDIDDKSGVSTEGNKKFLKKAEEMNKFDNDNLGIGGKNQSLVQFGDKIATGTGTPKNKESAFESVNEGKCNGSCVRKVGNDWRVVSNKTGKLWPQTYDSKESAEDALKAYHVHENKVKIGQIFTETKHNLKLKLTGLNEDKTKLNFIDESSNKKYSLLKENFKKALQEKKILRELDVATNFSQGTPNVQPAGYSVGDILETPEYGGKYLITKIENGQVIYKDLKYDEMSGDSTREVNDRINSGYYRVIQNNNNNMQTENKKLKEGRILNEWGFGNNEMQTNNQSMVQKYQEILNILKGSNIPFNLNNVTPPDFASGKRRFDVSANVRFDERNRLFEYAEWLKKNYPNLIQNAGSGSNNTNGENLQIIYIDVKDDSSQQFESKLKRLNFKKDNFVCESHMFSLIPEEYKVNGNKFYMKDASENEYLIEWNNNLKQKAVILEYKNEKKLNENMSRMKDLWNYNSSDTTKSLNEQERISEKQNIGNFIQKVKEISKKND